MVRVQPGELLEPIVIARRYRGPESSGNGGYTSGLVAQRVDAGTVEVTLRVPPPLERPLGRARVRRGGERPRRANLVAEARAAELDLELPQPVSYAEAVRLADATPPDP